MFVVRRYLPHFQPLDKIMLHRFNTTWWNSSCKKFLEFDPRKCDYTSFERAPALHKDQY